MKKFAAMLLALVMVFSLASAAFAAEDVPAKKPTSEYRSESVTADITIQKLYQLTGAADPDLYPAETLTFAATPDSTNPDGTNLTIADLEVQGNKDQKLVITLPVYSKVGTYKYTIAETTEKEMQGVTYSEDAIAVTVLVTYNYDAEKLDTQIVLSTADGSGGKVDTFVNGYDLGTLTLTKTVTGNLGAKDVYFDIDVTFTSEKEVASAITVSGGSHADNAATIAITDWVAGETGYTCTKTFKLKDSDKLTFADIPAGVTYTVKEADKHGLEGGTLDVNSAGDTDYTITYTNESGTIAADTTVNAAVENEKKTEVDTGIILESAPYVLMLAFAGMGLAAIFGKKRYGI